MALYHFSVRNVSRGKGQMVVASAAYISGQRIFDSYYNKIHDYTSKSGVIFTEILTPEYVPERLNDRETLWNEVEHVERNNKAQLAYSFDIALQNELTLEENIRLAKEFCQEQFVARGSTASWRRIRRSFRSNWNGNRRHHGPCLHHRSTENFCTEILYRSDRRSRGT